MMDYLYIRKSNLTFANRFSSCQCTATILTKVSLTANEGQMAFEMPAS